MTKTRWWLIGLLLIANMINYIDRVNLSFAAPHFMQLLHIGPAEMGVVLSAFLWTYFLLQVPSGMALDRWGVRFVFGGAAILWGAATMLTATITSATSLIIWRVLLGVGEAPSAPAGTKVLSQWLPDQERGFAGSLNIAGVPLGVFIGSPLISWLLATYSWQMVFIVTGLLAVLWGIGWIAYYRLPEHHAGANDAERNHILANNARLTRGDVPQRASWGQLLTNRNVMGLALGHATLLFNLYFFITWLPTYLIERHHMTMIHTGIYGSIPWLFGLAGALAGGAASDRLVRRGWPLMTARKAFLGLGMILSMGALVSVFTETTIWTVFWLSVAVFGLMLTNSVVWSANAEIAPLMQGGRVAGIQNCVGNAGGLLAPVIAGILLQSTGNWSAPLILAAFVALAGAGIYTFMLSDRGRFVVNERSPGIEAARLRP
ncbi:MFS transporter [Rhodopila sp.]|jgi:ACS family glucarate transporter-like MFS transporter|uniref:MFS transporter n=1 Tax=Rhodopila sp. TaxID=2480087 RepID=UPI002BD09EC4|nr:MFS transporter [Rhodopila sp.]HVZ09249.1 MFS transporter [Rhodopila sp.]